MTDQIDVGARWRVPRKRWRRNASVAVGIGVLVLTGCGPYQKAKLDREVDRLCAIDGGVHIYETVKLPKENFGPDGEVFPQYRTLPGSSGRYGPDYFSTVESQTGADTINGGAATTTSSAATTAASIGRLGSTSPRQAPAASNSRAASPGWCTTRPATAVPTAPQRA